MVDFAIGEGLLSMGLPGLVSSFTSRCATMYISSQCTVFSIPHIMYFFEPQDCISSASSLAIPDYFIQSPNIISSFTRCIFPGPHEGYGEGSSLEIKPPWPDDWPLSSCLLQEQGRANFFYLNHCEALSGNEIGNSLSTQHRKYILTRSLLKPGHISVDLLLLLPSDARQGV